MLEIRGFFTFAQNDNGGCECRGGGQNNNILHPFYHAVILLDLSRFLFEKLMEGQMSRNRNCKAISSCSRPKEGNKPSARSRTDRRISQECQKSGDSSHSFRMTMEAVSVEGVVRIITFCIPSLTLSSQRKVLSRPTEGSPRNTHNQGDSSLLSQNDSEVQGAVECRIEL